MLTDFNPCLLALGLEEILTAVFLIITFLSWVFQAINSKQDKDNDGKARNRRQQRQQQKESFESEIERFLQEVNSPDAKRDQPVRQHEPQRRPEPVARNRPTRPLSEEFEIEIIDEPPIRASRRQKQRGRKDRRPAQAAQPAAPVIKKKRESISERTLENKTLGANVSSHVEEYLDKDAREQQAHFRSLGQGVASSVAAHLGTAEGSSARTVNQSRAAKVRTLFQNQETVRQAILVNEILSKPKSLR
ncbi:MAG: hypothetical protein KDA65_19540 [Planctomycetaceae bacterium]|nr:hypothetical protein [Planctomycetaceae bacterium]